MLSVVMRLAVLGPYHLSNQTVMALGGLHALGGLTVLISIEVDIHLAIGSANVDGPLIFEVC